jgi:hypothetical protein
MVLPARPNPPDVWTAGRQGEGGPFVVKSQLSREEAERLVADFEARHKQVYQAERDQS